ncbi:hypothetical protein MMC07_004278 [Pseudocyphellaria aurata]|nr:hypothetical protein [Pseudocyphellaria aurata]
MEPASFRLTFGIEMEFIIHYDPDQYKDQQEARKRANQVRQDMVQILKKHGFPTNHIRLADRSKWTVATDVTVTSVDGSENWCAVEVKSPVLYYSGRALERVEQIVEFLVSKFDLSVNKTCGLHVHVGNEHKGFAMRTLKNFASLITVFERQLGSLHPTDRLQNIHAKPVHRVFRNDATPREKLSIIGRLDTVEALIRQFHTVGNPTPEEWLLSMAEWIPREDELFDRNMAFNFFNLQAGEPYQTIEFRQHQGTLNPNAITHWIRLACSLVELSHTGRVDLGDLIKSHIDDADYTVIDFFRDLSLPDLAEFYAPLV